MTSNPEFQVIAAALALVDKGLRDIQNRSLVPSDEVANLLLDLRLLLIASDTPAEAQLTH